SSLLEAWSGLWSAQLLQEDLRSAALTAERASESIPSHPEPWLTLALLRPDQARRYLGEGLTHNPSDYRLTVDYARQLFREQDLSGAQQAYTTAIAVAGDDPTVRIEAALLSEISSSALSWSGAQVLIDTRSQATTAEALRRVDGAVSQHPRSVLARVVRGNLHQITGDPAAAESDFKAALALSPSSTEANAALGLLLLSTRRPAEAIAPLKQATAQRPGDVALGLASAVALAEGSDPGAGGMAMLELQESFPYDAGPPLALAQLLMGLGESERAYAITLEAVQRMPEPQLMLALAATARAAGRPAEAAAALRKLGERTGDPRFEQAARQLLGSGQD
ncbi:MAG: Tfp pilus assembly protein PilF, partial [Myxococcota bacterium]